LLLNYFLPQCRSFLCFQLFSSSVPKRFFNLKKYINLIIFFFIFQKDQKESKEPKPEPPPPKFLKDWPTEKVRANEVGYGTLSAIKPDQLFPQQGAASKNNVSSNNRMVANKSY
uniref:Uncharacterized protein n=1 Tax=Meloidogyne incognita TaxID=6306 RepID=A0A914M5S5_MELIC